VRTLLVGLDNPHASNPRSELAPGTAILGDSGQRLCEMMLDALPGYEAEYYRNDFDRVNLYPSRLAANGKGATKMDRAMAQWCAMYAVAGEYENVVLLGNRVKVAFADLVDLSDDEQVVELGGREIKFYVVPHPSGRNRYYNDESNRIAVGELLVSLRERRHRERAR
jgi:hypothetical protein